MKPSESSSLVDYGSPVLSMRNDSPLSRKAPFALLLSFRTDPAKGEVRSVSTHPLIRHEEDISTVSP